MSLPVRVTVRVLVRVPVSEAESLPESLPESLAAPPATLNARQTTMTLADLDRVLAIEQQAYSHPWTRGNFIDSMYAGHLTWLRLNDQSPCLGYCVAMHGFEETHLLNLTVAPAQQRRGHGLALLQVLRRACVARGDALLWLEVRESNALARQLYTRFGFETVAWRRSYYPAGRGQREDAVVMRLTLKRSDSHALD